MMNSTTVRTNSRRHVKESTNSIDEIRLTTTSSWSALS